MNNVELLPLNIIEQYMTIANYGNININHLIRVNIITR